MRKASCLVMLFTAACVGLGLGAGCLPFTSQNPPPIRVGDQLWAEYVVSGADHPSALALAADGRVFYTEKNTGRIRVISDGELLPEPFATVPVNFAGKRGLLGIALHPAFEDNQRIYVFYSRSDTGLATDDPQAVIDNRVVYFEADGNVAGGGEVFVVSLPADAGTGRVGGRLGFDDDGKLLVAIGDTTNANGAARLGTLVGKVLRYNDDGSIPVDNPTPGSPVYARGLREPRGLCLDPADDTPFVIDRNPGDQSEANRIQAGKDYGWPEVTGRADTTAELEYAAANPDYVDPLLARAADAVGLVGGSFNPSTRYGPNTRWRLFYGEMRNRRVMSAELSSTRGAVIKTEPFATRFPSAITDVAFTPAGTLYVACENAVFRLVPAP